MTDGYNTEWVLSEAYRWGETSRIYPDGTIVRISQLGNGNYIADQFLTARDHAAGSWQVDGPLAGLVFGNAADAAEAADANDHTRAAFLSINTLVRTHLGPRTGARV